VGSSKGEVLRRGREVLRSEERKSRKKEDSFQLPSSGKKAKETSAEGFLCGRLKKWNASEQPGNWSRVRSTKKRGRRTRPPRIAERTGVSGGGVVVDGELVKRGDLQKARSGVTVALGRSTLVKANKENIDPGNGRKNRI